MLADNLLIFDNLRQTIKVMTLVQPEPGRAAAGPVRPGGGGHRRDHRAPAPAGAAGRGPPSTPAAAPDLQPTQERFEDMVSRAKEYIAAGDVIQVVLSQCFATPLRHDPFDLYRALRLINPSPYMFYLDQGDMKLVGASPEILVRLEDGQVSYRPIAGTRPRGATRRKTRPWKRSCWPTPRSGPST